MTVQPGNSKAQPTLEPEASGLYLPELLSVIIRTIDGRLGFLDETLFSLLCQDYSTVEAIVVYQGTSDGYRQELEALLECYRKDGLTLRLLQNPTKEDQRARNLNLGLDAARGQYVAFLDDDDVVYPEHYCELIGAMRTNGAAWAYANAYEVQCRFDSADSLYIFGILPSFQRPAYNFTQHWLENFIPIHSFAYDRLNLPVDNLRFPEDIDRMEDYAFLLALASRSDPTFIPRFTCEYRIRFDGSNSVGNGTLDPEELAQKQLKWDQAHKQLVEYRQHLDYSLRLPEIFEAFRDQTRDLKAQRIENAHLRSLLGVSPDQADIIQPLRYRLADKLMNRLNRHQKLKTLLKKTFLLVKRTIRR